MKIRLAGIAALLLAVAGVAHAQQPAPAAAPAPAQKATGLAAWAMVVGNTLTAKIDGKDHAEYYMADGSVKAMEGGSISKGRWALEGLKVCFTYPKEPKRCYAIEVDDKAATFTGADGSFRGEISKGNAKNL
jgi:hypothetical protein